MMPCSLYCALFCFLLVNYIAATAKTPETRAYTKLHREKRNTRGTSRSNIFSRLFRARGELSSGQTIRLRGSSSSPYANRVEVYINNKWGIICDDHWDITDANVACRQLGYPDGAASAPTQSRYGSDLHSRSDVLMYDTMCWGNEQSILDCPYSSRQDCQRGAASVVCRPGRGCPDAWVYNNGLCYRLFTDPQSFAQAQAQCTIQGGKLLYIDSQQENDFLSDWIINSYPQAEVRSGVWTGARWRAGAWNWTDSAVGRVKYTNWLPESLTCLERILGERLTESAPTNRCVKLVETTTERPPVRRDYFYWAEAGCSQTMPYVCKKIAQEPGDCYTGDGSSYRGKAFRTELGRLCINWSDVYATKWLGHHNHCRNPYGDERPWCWTNAAPRRFGYCQIPNCRETETSSVGTGIVNTTISSVMANCGSRPIVQPFFRIVGGYTATAGAYPWQAAIRKQYGVRWRQWCGATILNEDWLLSAAHCFLDAEKHRYRIRVGEHNLTGTDLYESDFQIEELIPHQRYHRRNHDYDFALLKISRNGKSGIQMSSHVQPACLPEPTTNYRPGLECFISGWGVDENRAVPQILKVAIVPLIDQNDCEMMYARYTTRVTPRMFCAGYRGGGIDACQGDSGGPLVCQVDGKHTLLGVTSWGRGCAQPNSPGIYARVTTVLDWIHTYVRQ